LVPHDRGMGGSLDGSLLAAPEPHGLGLREARRGGGRLA
jgi:hypothetical protein